MVTLTTFGCHSRSAHDAVQMEIPIDSELALHFHQQGMDAFEAGDYPAAIIAFRNAVKANPAFAEAHNSLGILHFEMGQLYQAAWEFETASRFAPASPLPLNNLGLVHEKADNLNEAIASYGLAVSMDATNAEYLGNLVRARRKNDEWDESLEQELQQLVYLENRPGWKQWAHDQLAMGRGRGAYGNARTDIVGHTGNSSDDQKPIPSVIEVAIPAPEPAPLLLLPEKAPTDPMP